MDTGFIAFHLQHARHEDAAWREKARGMERLAPDFALSRLQTLLRIARLAWVADDETGARAALGRAARWARALAAIDLPDGAALQWQDDEGGWRIACSSAVLTPLLAIQGIAAASLCEDNAALRTLLRRGLFERIVRDARQRDAAVGGEQFWALLGELFAAVVGNEQPQAEAFTACRQALDAPDVRNSAFDPDARAQLVRPLIDCLQALADADQVNWDRTLSAAIAEHQAYFAAPEKSGLLLGFLFVELSALVASGRQRHGWADIEAPEVMTSALPAGPAAELVRVYPPRSARDARQAHWRMDLDGAPRTRRTHVLREREGGLVADYTIEDGFAVDRWRAVFLLRDDAPALDAGELLAVSDVLAGQVTAQPGDPAGERHAQRILLQEAIDALTLLRAMFTDEGLPDDAFHSAIGRAMRAAEPGAFDVGRLDARLAAYAHLQASLRDDAATALPASRGSQAQAIAMGAIELLRQQLTPLLHALGRDRDGSLTAQLRPRPEDYARAFLPQYAEAARTAFEAIWAEPPRISPALPGSELKLNIAPAGMLADDNALSWNFPGGYRSVAPLLNPHRVWAAWKLIAPGKSAGMAYDGLVWLDDHWAWFPKPYRVLASLIKP